MVFGSSAEGEGLTGVSFGFSAERGIFPPALGRLAGGLSLAGAEGFSDDGFWAVSEGSFRDGPSAGPGGGAGEGFPSGGFLAGSADSFGDGPAAGPGTGGDVGGDAGAVEGDETSGYEGDIGGFVVMR